jgi:hypothetical protein
MRAEVLICRLTAPLHKAIPRLVEPTWREGLGAGFQRGVMLFGSIEHAPLSRARSISTDKRRSRSRCPAAGLSSVAEVLPRKQGAGVRFPQPAPR